VIDPVITLDEADRWRNFGRSLLKGQKIQKEAD